MVVGGGLNMSPTSVSLSEWGVLILNNLLIIATYAVYGLQ